MVFTELWNVKKQILSNILFLIDFIYAFNLPSERPVQYNPEHHKTAQKV